MNLRNRLQRVLSCVLLAVVALPSLASAQSIREEYGTLFERSRKIEFPGFGDAYDPYTGRLNFKATDISLPGQGSVPVQLRRLVRVDHGRYIGSAEQFGGWELDIPYLFGTFASVPGGGWNVAAAGGRCSGPANAYQSRPTAPGTAFSSYSFWHGNSLHHPDHGDSEIGFISSDARLAKPTDGLTYRYATRDLWLFSCLGSLKGGGTGEGFLAVAPDGTRYHFDWMTEYQVNGITKPGMAPNLTILLPRKEVRIYPTRIEDRHGNWVTYEWSGRNLLRIQAKDGRQITLTHGPDDQIDSATDGTRTWTYTYDPSRYTLTSVNNPDGTQWRYESFAHLQGRGIYDNSYTGAPGCGVTGTCGQDRRYVMDELMICSWMRKFSDVTMSARVVAPSGAIADFVLKPMRRGRRNVTSMCIDTGDFLDSYSAYNMYPVFFDSMALQSKRVTVGSTSDTWTYSYTAPEGSVTDPGIPPYGGSTGISGTTVSRPDGSTERFEYGNGYDANEGQLLRHTITGGQATATTVHEYHSEQVHGTAPFPASIGSSGQTFAPKNGFALAPRVRTSITLDGVTFVNHAQQFDRFARPVRQHRASSLGQRTDLSTFEDNLSRWVLGLPLTQVNEDTGLVEQQVEYDPWSALPRSYWKNGKLDRQLTYHADGSAHTITDALGRITRLTNWYRGVPRLVTLPDGTTQAAIVSAQGDITRHTDQNGFATNYQYDLAGRMTRSTPPSGDTTTWNPTIASFSKTTSPALGFPAGTWHQKVSTGSGTKVTYFDALWRPVLAHEYDAANIAGTSRYVAWDYDHDGRLTFESYPTSAAASAAALVQGVWTDYDALGRVVSTARDSEHGPLVTLTQYLSGFRTRQTDPRGNATITSYLAWDRPDHSLPVQIAAPLGSTTSMVRDALGRPTRVTRSGTWLGGAQTLHHDIRYDAHGRVERRWTPEEGATYFDYDAVDNLVHTYVCDLASDAKCGWRVTGVRPEERTTRTYDALDRVLSISYPDAANDATYTYTPDGLLATLTSDGSTWTYQYNRRRLLTQEKLWMYSDYILDYGYNSNGHLASASNAMVSIDYAPNGLGQATQAGSYASGVEYHANGAVKRFTYGNGIVRTLVQNARLLPEVSTYAQPDGTAIHRFDLDFDANGNVVRSRDWSDPANNRAMEYDALDRLTYVSNNQAWTAARYTYDALDNLRSSEITRGGVTETLGYAYDVRNRLGSVTRTGQPAWTYATDPRGNIRNDGRHAYQWTSADRLLSIAGKESYQYDGHGRRTVIWRNDGTASVPVYGADGTLRLTADNRLGGTTTHVYLGDDNIADVFFRWSDGALTTRYLHSDPLGSPIARTDQNRVTLSTALYEPYGQVTDGPTGLDDPVNGIGYTGHALDTASGLVYMQQRYYDPVTGRFLSPDPVDVDPESGASFNRYAYAENNPYRFVDPDGMSSEEAFAQLGELVAVEISKYQYRNSTNKAQKIRLGNHLALIHAIKYGDRAGAERYRLEVDSLKGAPDGVVYRRINPKTGEIYIGQAISPQRYQERQREHNREQRASHVYEVLERAKPGAALDVAEETQIRNHGGLKGRRTDGGGTVNKRHQMSDTRYRTNGGRQPLPLGTRIRRR